VAVALTLGIYIGRQHVKTTAKTVVKKTSKKRTS
jgi:hypothetical protein